MAKGAPNPFRHPHVVLRIAVSVQGVPPGADRVPSGIPEVLYRPHPTTTGGTTVGTVDLPGLEKVGSGIEGCYHDFDRARTGHAGQLDPTLDAAWASGKATTDAATAWQAFLGQLATQVQELGRNLSGSARQLRAADDRAAARSTRAGAGIPAGHPAEGRAHGYHP
jgi:hypothetical protein